MRHHLPKVTTERQEKGGNFKKKCFYLGSGWANFSFVHRVWMLVCNMIGSYHQPFRYIADNRPSSSEILSREQGQDDGTLQLLLV